MQPEIPVSPFSIGLTGGIGSGKSLVADLLAVRGAAIIDTDVIAHQLTAAGGAAIPPIREAFGAAVINAEGALDRAAMREKVFADPEARRRLESILHPMIGRETDRAAESAAAAPYQVFVVPLLAESGRWKERVDRVLVVDCPEALQVERVMRRNQLSEGQVRAIMAAQANRMQRLALADDVIVNDGPLAEVEAATDRLHASYLAMAAKKHAEAGAGRL